MSQNNWNEMWFFFFSLWYQRIRNVDFPALFGRGDFFNFKCLYDACTHVCTCLCVCVHFSILSICCMVSYINMGLKMSTFVPLLTKASLLNSPKTPDSEIWSFTSNFGKHQCWTIVLLLWIVSKIQWKKHLSGNTIKVHLLSESAD